MLLEKFKKYLDKVFRPLPDSKEVRDFREELLGNLMSNAIDMQKEGYEEDEIYEKCVNNLGDYREHIRALSGNPIAVVRDARVQKSVIYTIMFILTCVVAYILVGLFVPGGWAVGAYTIFPAMAIVIYLYYTGNILIRNFALKKHATTGVIFASYYIFAVLLVFLNMILVFDLPAAKSWVVFPSYGMAIMAIHIGMQFLRGKKPALSAYMALINFTAVEAYLITAVLTGLWHPYWIIAVAGFVVSTFVLLLKQIRKIDEREARRR